MATATRQSSLRLPGLAFAVIAFVAAPALFVYLAVFLGNFWPLSSPWIEPTVDVGPTFAPLGAALNDIALIAFFGLQHSLMSRSSIKAWLLRFCPPDLERSIYVAASSLALALLLVLWRPIPIVLYDLGDGLLEDLVWSVFAMGWLLLLAALITIGPRDLLGLNQALAWFRSKRYETPPLTLSWLYERVRHPMYTALLVVVWVTPYMTAGHALLAAGFSLYIAIGIQFEERDLARRYGADFEAYRKRTPALLPRIFN